MAQPSSTQPRPPVMQAILAKFAASRFLTTSLVIHIALVTLLGSVVMFKAAQQQDAFVASVGTDGILTDSAEDLGETPETPQEFEEPSAPSSAEANPVSPASAIASLTEAGSFTISAPSDQQMFGSTLGMTDRMIPTSTSTGGARGSSGGGRLSGSLFGVKIETKKLGVMLDISGSAHPFLLGALQEIDKSFKGMPTVLVFGCGAKKDIKSSAFSMKEASKSDKDYKKIAEVIEKSPKDKDANETVYGQVAKARLNPKLKDLDRYLNRMTNRPDVFYSVNDKGVNPRFGADHVMKFLADQDVDTIYWFSDLADEFDLKAAEEIGKKLHQKGVRVIAHDFSGNPKSASVAAARKIVELTGGELISKKISSK